MIELLRRGVVHVAFRLNEHVNQITVLLRKYSDAPMSLADACLVRMSELYADSSVLTLDDDFRIYRKNKRGIIPIISSPDL